MQLLDQKNNKSIILFHCRIFSNRMTALLSTSLLPLEPVDRLERRHGASAWHLCCARGGSQQRPVSSQSACVLYADFEPS